MHSTASLGQTGLRSTVDRATQTSPIFSYRPITPPSLEILNSGPSRTAASPSLPGPALAANSESPEPSATAVIACYVLLRIIRTYLE